MFSNFIKQAGNNILSVVSNEYQMRAEEARAAQRVGGSFGAAHAHAHADDRMQYMSYNERQETAKMVNAVALLTGK